MKKSVILAKVLSMLLAMALLFGGCSVIEGSDISLDDITGIVDDIAGLMDDLEPSAAPPINSPPAVQASPIPSAGEVQPSPSPLPSADSGQRIDEDGSYNTRDEVALYIHTYGHLPGNYITKRDAEGLGWISAEGNLWDVAYGMSIGGDVFGNREGLLPGAKGRKWYECDIGYEGGYRSGERVVFSNDGLIYYTADHYETFTQLY